MSDQAVGQLLSSTGNMNMVSCDPSNSSILERAIAEIRTKAVELRDDFSDEGRARTLEWAAAKLDLVLFQEATQLVSLDEAARISGYSSDHIARMVRDGKIPDRRVPGTKGRILIHRSDLPRKPATSHLGSTDDTDSPAAS